MRNKLFTRIIITTLLVTLLTFNVGRVTRVSAMAEEITPELEPVYDTEVVSLQDYVDNVLSDAQVAVFNILLGSYVASQAGLNEYELEYPYTDRSGVIGWLQDAGMKLYNAIITGGSFDLVTGTDLRTYIVTAASFAIGMAQKARTYTDMNDFLDDVDNSDHYFIPYDPILQASINSYFGRSYGLWNWQFSDAGPFVSNNEYVIASMSDYYMNLYNSNKSSYSEPYVRFNDYRYSGRRKNALLLFNQFSDYHNLFINTLDHTLTIVSDSGSALPANSLTKELFYDSVNPNVYLNTFDTFVNALTSLGTYSESQYSTIRDVANAFFQNQFNWYYYNQNQFYIFYSDFVDTVYAGDTWATKLQVFNIGNLNFAQNDSPSYNQVPDNSYIDLKGFLTDIVNNTNILNVILDNLFKPDGTLNVDPSLIKVSITIPDTNPLPVNLNDIQEYTDNVYLDVVRERVDAFSDTVGSFVAFWHNIDYEIVYAVFGSALIVLLGAFVGKWGHS